MSNLCTQTNVLWAIFNASAAERIRGARDKIISGALWIIIFSTAELKRGGQYSKALRIYASKRGRYCLTLAAILMEPCSILGYFLNWGPLIVVWRPGASCPLATLAPPSRRPCLRQLKMCHMWHEINLFDVMSSIFTSLDRRSDV